MPNVALRIYRITISDHNIPTIQFVVRASSEDRAIRFAEVIMAPEHLNPYIKITAEETLEGPFGGL